MTISDVLPIVAHACGVLCFAAGFVCSTLCFWFFVIHSNQR